MSIAYQSDKALVWQGDSLELMRSLPDGCMDSVVTDPPYNLSFMGRKWDSIDGSFQHWCEEWARECLRLLKPGGHLLAFGGTRTWHRLAAGIEDAGFELRDSIAWLYGSGFPKSLDVSKAIDKAAGVEFSARPAAGVGFMNAEGSGGYNVTRNQLTREGEQTQAAHDWEGWGTALKPAFEPIVVARKPFVGTVAANILEHGVGAVNIDASRIEGGRWPANVVLDVGQAAALDAQAGPLHTQKPTGPATMKSSHWGGGKPMAREVQRDDGDRDGASRFFYVAKASSNERPKVEGAAHPTVKPLKLMRWLVRLVTPEGGTVLDPFAGSGTTVEACLLEGFRCMGMEREDDYVPLILHRIERSG